MANQPLITASVALTLVAGTAATLLAILAWEILHRSPLGRAVAMLTIVLGAFTVYHITVLVIPAEIVYVRAIKSVVGTGAALFVWWIVLVDRKLHRNSTKGAVNQ